ncbi:MAG TPA: HupE/UreJ family protein, partial [Rhodospirillales bacterium]|nr:HupE/UreJ family protein [Rhodospirillales bacterium]
MLLLAGFVAPASAHQPSESFLTLIIGAGGGIDGRWDIALRDLDQAVGLDADDDGAITWGEVRARRAPIVAYAFSRLELSANRQPCPITPGALLIDAHTGGTYAVVRFAAVCGAARPGPVSVRYRLLFDIDPQHRGLLKTERDGLVGAAVFQPDRPEWTIEAGKPPPGRTFLLYFEEGARHIVGGLDHLLFIVCLLLPAVVRRQDGGWRAVGRFREAAGDVVKVVTAFTIAHSLTLALATFGWIRLGPEIVHPLIAASIVFTALNNLYSLVTRGLWAVAFGFGLLHGIGFADALSGLGLPTAALLLPLLAFNLGVEAGQLLIVAAFLPFAF